MANKSNDDIAKQVLKVVKEKATKGLRKGITQSYVEELRDRIVTRSRLGIGVDPESGKGYRFPELSKPYIRRRKGAKSLKKRLASDARQRKRAKAESEKRGEKVKPNLSSKTTPAKSNITATGQLLNSLSVVKLKLKNAFGFKIVIGDRRGRDLFGNRSKIGNKKLTEYLAKQGRTFFGFTKAQRNQIAKEIRDFIIKGLK